MFGWSSLDETAKRHLVEAIVGSRPSPPPHHAVLDLTDGCDTAEHLNRKGAVPWSDGPPLTRVRSLLDDLAEAGVRSVRLGGTGDPLLHPELPAVLSALDERGLELDEVVTTGIPATDLVVERLVSLPCRTIRILAGGARPADFMRTTGIDQFHFYRLLDTAEGIVSRRGPRDEPRLAFHFVVHRENVPDLPRMYRLGREIGAGEIAVGSSYELGPELELGTLALRPEHRDELLDPLTNLLAMDRERRLLRLCFPWPNHDELVAALPAEGSEAAPSAPSFDERDTGHCLLGWLSITVGSDGSVHPCPILARAAPDRPLGRLDGESAAELWRGDPLEELRGEMREVFLARGRLFAGADRLDRLAPRCVAPRGCALKHRYRDDDEWFDRSVSDSLEAARRGLSPSDLRRRAEETAYRIYHGIATRWPSRGRDGEHSTGGERPRDVSPPGALPDDRDDDMKSIVESPSAVPSLESPRLHIGSGVQRLEGWINVDIANLPGVDLALDVREGLPFDDVEAIFAEHFIEHLTLAEALDFLVEAHRVLRPDAWLRLSTPSLEWVWENSLDPDDPASARLTGALRLNRAFHGWGHRFLWNRSLLDAALHAVGFEDLHWCRYGESERDVFHAVERHERYADTPELPHVLIVEARKGAPEAEVLEELRAHLEEEYLRYLEEPSS